MRLKRKLDKGDKPGRWSTKCAWVHGRCAEGVQREHGGAQMCVERCTRVRKGAQGCAKVHKGARMCAKRCAIVRKRYARCTQMHERCGQVHKWGRSLGRVGGWCGCGGCRPSAEKVKKVENFRKIFESVPVLTGLTTKIDLEGVDGGGTRPGGVWGECQLSLEGSGSPGGGGEPEWVCTCARKIKNRIGLNGKLTSLIEKKGESCFQDDGWATENWLGG